MAQSLAATIQRHRAVEMSFYVVRAFVQLREMLASNKELACRFAQLETRLHKKPTVHDIAAILSAIRPLMYPPVRSAGLSASLQIFVKRCGDIAKMATFVKRQRPNAVPALVPNRRIVSVNRASQIGPLIGQMYRHGVINSKRSLCRLVPKLTMQPLIGLRHPWSGVCFHAHTIDVFDTRDRGVLAISHGRPRINSSAFTTQRGATLRGRRAG
jgi:hypothetical protein